MLAQLLMHRGIAATSAMPGENAAPSHEKPGLICISYFGAKFRPTHARFLMRRLRRQYPDVPVLAGYWAVESEHGEATTTSAASEADFAATRFAQALDICIASLAAPQRSADETRGDRPVASDIPAKAPQAAGAA